MVFNKEDLRVKNDSIFGYKTDSLIGIIDTITLHYGVRRKTKVTVKLQVSLQSFWHKSVSL